MKLLTFNCYSQAFTQLISVLCAKVCSKSIAFLVIALNIMLCSIPTYAEHAKNFAEAKKNARIIWADNRLTFYCGCKFDKELNIDFKSCEYDPKDNRRARRAEWEHVVPAKWMANHYECSRELICEKKNGKRYKGRACCLKQEPEFRKAHNDLYNLVPAIGSVNMARNNYRFIEGDFSLRDKQYEGCSIYIDRKNRAVIPSREIKGFIARAHLYMDTTYTYKLSEKQRKMYQAWDKQYPPSLWEKRWAEKVADIQGNTNSFIQNHMSK